MSAAPGWYGDPWGQAESRWWDGTSWSGWTHPPIDHPAAEQPAHALSDRGVAAGGGAPIDLPQHRGGLADVLAGLDRITVVDVETTGLYRSDRIVEIGMVTMDGAGNTISELDTLVRPTPGHDVGPTRIHGITATMVAQAPAFSEIADHVADRLEGSVVVAHNLRFDTRMLQQEFDRLGYVVDWGVGLDTLRVTGCALGTACAEYGIPLTGAHRALLDARATARLLIAVRNAFTAACAPVSIAPLRNAPAARVLTRDGFVEVPVEAPCLPALARGVHADHDVAPYVDLLDQALMDLQLTTAERTELTAIADDLGLSALDRERAHKEFLNGLIDAATEDGAVTDTELDHLLRVAALLALDQDLVIAHTNPYRLTHDTVTLAPGMKVCFTGEAVDELGALIDRSSVLNPEAVRHGLVPNKSFTRACELLIVSDAATTSSKMMAARKSGTPVAVLADYRRALAEGGPLAVTRATSLGTALMCGQCGSSWVAARRSTDPVCGRCARAAAPVRSPVPTKTLRQLKTEMRQATAVPPKYETLVCSKCGNRWQRPRTRGRPPTRCPTCVLQSIGVRT